MSNAVSLVEHNHLSEMHASLRRKLSESQKADQARTDSIRSTVLSAVVGENYDSARDELQNYVDMKSSFPGFQARAERYVQHCSELIHAIQTKRNFPGLASLSLAKQQEVHEKVLQHFDELKHNLKHIERVELDGLGGANFRSGRDGNRGHGFPHRP
jgi:nucleoid DNA-binding protein